jgi:hypothetical protein
VPDTAVGLLIVGVKDVILPGEMQTILNQVVEAEKVDKLTVFGGLDGVLKDVVRIRAEG